MWEKIYIRKSTDALGKDVEMNGISLKSFYGNAGLFTNNMFNKNVSPISGMNVKVQSKGADKDNGVQTNADNDTYEHNSMLIQAQNANAKVRGGRDWVLYGKLAFYSYDETKIDKPPVFAELDSDGVSKGLTLSDKAKSFLDELKKKYKYVDITVAGLSTTAEKEYYQGLSNRGKECSLLIDAEAFEADAARDIKYGRSFTETALEELDRKAREEMLAGGMDIAAVQLDGEQNETNRLRRAEWIEAGNESKPKAIYCKIDETGEKDYVVRLLKDMTQKEDEQEDKKTLGEIQREHIEEKKEEVRQEEEVEKPRL